MKRRNIEKDEINEITKKRKPREQAFFTIMRQSGLTPNTIKQLRIKNVEKILEQNPPIPCKIDLPQKLRKGKLGKIPAFIGEEAIKHLKDYLSADRTNLTPESLLFTLHNNPNREINTKDVSREFKTAARELEKSKKPIHEVKKGKSNELRLFSLIDFYRENAKPYLKEINSNPSSNDDESYRKLYEEKAMRFLEIELLTTSALHSRDNRINEMKQQLAKNTEFISSILTVLYDNKGDRETGENIRRGEDFIELLKEVNEIQLKNLWDAWQSEGKIKHLPLRDITEELTKTLKNIKKPYDELNQQINNDRKEE